LIQSITIYYKTNETLALTLETSHLTVPNYSDQSIFTRTIKINRRLATARKTLYGKKNIKKSLGRLIYSKDLKKVWMQLL
jgi:hypothetical protein